MEKFLRDLYVDDSTSGAESVEKGIKFYDKAKNIMLAAGFDLRKWTTNDPTLQKYFDVKENVNSKIEHNDNDITYAKSELGKSNSDSSAKKVLGIEWDTNKDLLVYQFDDLLRTARELKPTKRNILRIVASFYDPLGLVSPVTIKFKILFQRLCKDKLGWDDIMSEDTRLVWEDILGELESLRRVSVERFVCCGASEGECVQAHGFCDSSEQAYCAAVYFRQVRPQGVRVKLACAKTKVAPLNKVSVPRLELLSCVLLSKLIGCVREALNSVFDNLDCYCWSDSEVALCWLKGNTKSWKPWVENRVVKCRKEVAKERWNHVSGKINPADIPTRLGKSVLNDVWFEGPEFLKKVDFKIEDIVSAKRFDLMKKVLEEAKKSVKKKFVDECNENNLDEINKEIGDEVLNADEVIEDNIQKDDVVERVGVEVGNLDDVNLIEVVESDKIDDEGAGEEVVKFVEVCNFEGEDEKLLKEVMVEHVNNVSKVRVDDNLKNTAKYCLNEIISMDKFSTLQKLINTTAYVFRFVNNLKSRVRKRKDDVIMDEIITVEEYKFSLEQWIKTEQYLIKQQSNFGKVSNSLNLFECKDGFLRLRGRFDNASLCYDQRYPILLRGGESGFTRLLIRDSHNQVLHHGIETTLNHIRSKYWIIKGRKTVKDIVLFASVSKERLLQHLPHQIYLIIEWTVIFVLIQSELIMQDLYLLKIETLSPRSTFCYLLALLVARFTLS